MQKRLAALSEKRRGGQKSIACFPLYPPVELFHSMGLVPAVLWGLDARNDEVAVADRHVQNYVCSVGRKLAGFLVSRGPELFDAFFFYNACDTLRNLPEIVTAGVTGRGKCMPAFRLHIPQASLSPEKSAAYLAQAIEDLVNKLSRELAVSFSPDSFARSIGLYGKARGLCGMLEEKCRQGLLPFSRFADAVMAGYGTDVEAHLVLLEDLLAEKSLRSVSEGAPGVFLTGVLPPPAAVSDAMEEAGLRVAGNDLAALYRSYAYTPALEAPNPAAFYGDLYENHFPCTTLLQTADRRLDALVSRIRETGSRAVVFVGEKFCEYEYFELPLLSEKLKGQGIPLLFLELALEDTVNFAAIRNRIFAFAEMIGSAGV
ncbi:MAG: 2-hydroxyacyl-CoA dehydratase family protein [Thermodesulfobacteriota bacterium]